MQAMNILESQNTIGSTACWPTPVNVTEQGMAASVSNATPAQAQPVTPVSFVFTTQVRLDTAIPPVVSQVLPKVPPARVPLSQITSVASTANVAPSLTSQQTETTSMTQPQQENWEQCRKCGKRNHITARCCTK